MKSIVALIPDEKGKKKAGEIRYIENQHTNYELKAVIIGHVDILPFADKTDVNRFRQALFNAISQREHVQSLNQPDPFDCVGCGDR